LALVAPVRPVYAQEHPVTLYFFWGSGCPHCAQEEKFLATLPKTYPTLTIKKFEVWGSTKNRGLFKTVAQKLGAEVSGVPFTVVGTNYVGGYYTDDTTGAEISQYVATCVQTGCTDVVTEFIPTAPERKPIPWASAPTSLPREVTLPVLGRINLTTLSLPAIAIVIGTLDGFNPCAMWALLFLISLLLNLPNKKRRWFLGLAFLMASGLVYFLFMAAWLNILLFIGVIVWVRLAIALFALAAGAVSLRRFWQHHTGCVVEANPNRQATFAKLKQATFSTSLLVAVVGIVSLAFAVNLVELLCSAGFPAIFTQILALNQLSTAQYYFYVLLYILFFMADDLIIFAIAMKTAEATGISTKYVKYSHLVGGVLMVLIGAALIGKPELLTFSF
jgi:hypothetical protein